MKFGFAQQFSFEIVKKMAFVSSISDGLKDTFDKKNYSDDLTAMYVGLSVFSPQFANFFTIKKARYSNSILEFEIRIDYDFAQSSTELEITRNIEKKLIQSADLIKKRVSDFKKESFIHDVQEYFNNNI